MTSLKTTIIAVVLITLFSITLVAQVESPKVMKLKLKKAKIEGYSKNSTLLDVESIYLNEKYQLVYLFKTWQEVVAAPRGTWKYRVGYADSFGNFKQIGTAENLEQVYNGEVKFDQGMQPYSYGKVVVVAKDGGEFPKVVMMGSKMNLTTIGDSTPLFDFKKEIKTMKMGVDLKNVSLKFGEDGEGKTNLITSVNTIDKNKKPYDYSSESTAWQFDLVKGFSKGKEINMPKGEENRSTHFGSMNTDFWAGYDTRFGDSYSGSNYRSPEEGTIFITPAGKFKVSFSITPAAKLRSREVAKSKEEHIDYPLRQPRLVEDSNGDYGVVYQALKFAQGTSVQSYDISYYYQKLSSKGRADGKPVLLDYPAWKKPLKEVEDSYGYSHYHAPSEYINIGDGNYCFMEFRNFERRYFAAPEGQAVAPPKATDTDLQARILLFNSDTLEVKEIAQLKLKFADKDMIHRSWALDSGDSMDFVISIFRNSSQEYEVLKTSLDKSDF